MLQAVVTKAANAEVFDRLSKPLLGVVSKAVKPRVVRNTLSGTPIGHPLHPMLTDIPIGAWGASALLDLIGGRSSRRAADLLITAGIVSAVPTAAAGLNDLSDTYGEETRIGMAHAVAIHVGLAAYLASLAARSRGHRGFGKLLGLAGFGAVALGGYLGGHLSFVKGTNVNRAAWLEPTTDWTDVCADGDLAERKPLRADAGGTPVLLYRHGGTIDALSAVCTHMGGPLDEGPIADGCVTCPWHGSVFRLSDGSIERGPACNPQPRYETRVHDGMVQVRSPQ